MSKSPYPPQLISWAKDSSHRGMRIAHPTIQGSAKNKTCGDHVSVRILLSGDVISQAEYDGESCAISQASSGALCKIIEGNHLSVLPERFRELRRAISDGLISTSAGLESFHVVHAHPTRHRCALLVVEAFENALRGKDE